MDILLANHRYTLAHPFAGGGEGDIYQISSDTAAKVYHSHVICHDRRLKVLALCNSYVNNVQHFGSQFFAFPRSPAYEGSESIDRLCGLGMSFFPNLAKLDEASFDPGTGDFKGLGGGQLSDKSAIDFAYKVFELLGQLHKSRIVLGDLNPGNILIDRTSLIPVLVDLDSAQVGSFRCLAYSPEYIDPMIQAQGRNATGGYTYNTEADIFSLACIMFEFLVGAHPYSLRTIPTLDIEAKKQKGLSYFAIIDGLNHLFSGVTHKASPVDAEVHSRFKHLVSRDQRLCDFFRSVFVDGHRNSLIENLDRSDPRHPAYVFFSQSGFETILSGIQKNRAAAAVAAARPFAMPESGFHLSSPRLHPPSPSGVPQMRTAGSGAALLPPSGFAELFNSQQDVSSTSASPTPVLTAVGRDPQGLYLFASAYGVDLTTLS